MARPARIEYEGAFYHKRYEIKAVGVKASHVNALRRKINKILTKGDEAVLSLAIKEKTKGILTVMMASAR